VKSQSSNNAQSILKAFLGAYSNPLFFHHSPPFTWFLGELSESGFRMEMPYFPVFLPGRLWPWNYCLRQRWPSQLIRLIQNANMITTVYFPGWFLCHFSLSISLQALGNFDRFVLVILYFCWLFQVTPPRMGTFGIFLPVLILQLLNDLARIGIFLLCLGSRNTEDVKHRLGALIVQLPVICRSRSQ